MGNELVATLGIKSQDLGILDLLQWWLHASFLFTAFSIEPLKAP